MRNKIVVLALILGLNVLPGYAQFEPELARYEVTPFVGYQFGGKLSVFDGDIKIKSAWNYGVAFDISIKPRVQVEFLYLRQDTELELENIQGENATLFDMTAQYFHIGGLYEGRGGQVKPYGLISVGLTHFNPKPAARDSAWRFSWGFGVGVKLFPSQHIGLRLQWQLLFPYVLSGSSLWCTPNRCYVTVSDNMIIQINFTAGLVLAF